MESIKFFDRSNPYFEFSNYYSCTFVVEDRVWHSVESYYQSQKFNDARTNLYYQLIAQADSPQKAKDMGNLRPNPRGSNWLINKNCPELGKMNEIIREFKTDTHIRSDWDEVKVKVMQKGLHAKFSQNPHLMDSLLSTGDKELLEASPFDAYWGTGPRGDGKNHLGKLLMRLRTHFQTP
jgi:N-glycosidase YbiA